MHIFIGEQETSPCSPRAPNLLHMLPSRMVGWNELYNPVFAMIFMLEMLEQKIRKSDERAE